MWPTRTDERLRTGVFPQMIEQLLSDLSFRMIQVIVQL
jgi:hypothetical protein